MNAGRESLRQRSALDTDEIQPALMVPRSGMPLALRPFPALGALEGGIRGEGEGPEDAGSACTDGLALGQQRHLKLPHTVRLQRS